MFKGKAYETNVWKMDLPSTNLRRGSRRKCARDAGRGFRHGGRTAQGVYVQGYKLRQSGENL